MKRNAAGSPPRGTGSQRSCSPPIRLCPEDGGSGALQIVIGECSMTKMSVDLKRYIASFIAEAQMLLAVRGTSREWKCLADEAMRHLYAQGSVTPRLLAAMLRLGLSGAELTVPHGAEGVLVKCASMGLSYEGVRSMDLATMAIHDATRVGEAIRVVCPGLKALRVSHGVKELTGLYTAIAPLGLEAVTVGILEVESPPPTSKPQLDIHCDMFFLAVGTLCCRATSTTWRRLSKYRS
jgi:hypothetical protein